LGKFFYYRREESKSYEGVEVWRCGGVEVWRCGGVEVWRYGDMEVWRGGKVIGEIHLLTCARTGGVTLLCCACPVA